MVRPEDELTGAAYVGSNLSMHTSDEHLLSISGCPPYLDRGSCHSVRLC